MTLRPHTWILLGLMMLLARGASAGDVVVLGDSWGVLGAPPLQDVIDTHHPYAGIEVFDAAVGGSTATGLAADLQNPAYVDALVTDLVAWNIDPEWVWLSTGGNDVMWYLQNGWTTGDAMGAYAAALQSVLDSLFALDPTLEVVLIGYDYPNFQKPGCAAMGTSIFGTDTNGDGVKDTPPWAIKVNILTLITLGWVQQSVASADPRVTYVPSTWGTLQIAGGTPNAPNLWYPSPPSMIDESCIHPSAAGWDAIMDEFYAAYWAAELMGLP